MKTLYKISGLVVMRVIATQTDDLTGFSASRLFGLHSGTRFCHSNVYLWLHLELNFVYPRERLRQQIRKMCAVLVWRIYCLGTLSLEFLCCFRMIDKFAVICLPCRKSGKFQKKWDNNFEHFVRMSSKTYTFATAATRSRRKKLSTVLN